MSNIFTHKCNLGADPEFFIVRRKLPDGKRVEEVVSADKFLPGKRNKEIVLDGYAFFDGVQAEINPVQSNCRELFIGHVRNNLVDVVKIIKNKKKSTDSLKGLYALYAVPTKSITPTTIKGADKECTRFGCSPESTIYDDVINKYPDGKKHMLRYAGGHIHFSGIDVATNKFFADIDKVERFIQNLDAIAGVTSVLLTNETAELERLRRKYYGKAGAHRYANGRLEYRTLSSFWLASPILLSLVFSLARFGMTLTMFDLDEDIKNYADKDQDRVRHIVNNVDREDAWKFYKKFLVPTFDKYRKIINKEDMYKEAKRREISMNPFIKPSLRKKIEERLFIPGFEVTFNPKRMISNWNINGDSFDAFFGVERWLRSQNEEKI